MCVAFGVKICISVQLSSVMDRSLCLLVYLSVQLHFPSVLNHIQPVRFRIFDFHTPHHSPPLHYFFLFNYSSSHTTILSIPHCCSLPHLLNTLPFSFYFLAPLSLATTSCLSPLASFLPLPRFCFRWALLQRAVRTPSAVHAAPVCPASTGTPKRLSRHCSLESPMGARVTLCPPLVCGWAPA